MYHRSCNVIGVAVLLILGALVLAGLLVTTANSGLELNISMPILIIIGIMGLFAFFGAKELFGPNRVTHAEVKAAYKATKARQKRR